MRPAGAGEEWLGLPAPPVEGEEEEEKNVEGMLALLQSTAAPPPHPPPPSSSSFRSLHAAVAAALDGDIIRLLPGTHNALSTSVVVAKRVLITGGGGGPALGGGTLTPPPLRAATLDGRANAPALRLRGACVLHGLAVEGTGFRETVRLEPAGHGVAEGGRGWAAPPGGAPILIDCTISSAGDEAVAALGPPLPRSPRAGDAARWAPTLLRCTIGPAKRGGLSARGGVRVRLEGCAVKGSGGVGVLAQGGAAVEVAGPGAAIRRCGGGGRRRLRCLVPLDTV